MFSFFFLSNLPKHNLIKKKKWVLVWFHTKPTSPNLFLMRCYLKDWASLPKYLTPSKMSSQPTILYLIDCPHGPYYSTL